ncbi:hypothetical protein ES705_46522 [subsurface metagenome]
MDFILGKGIQGENLAPGEEGRGNLKGWIFGGSANKGNSAILNEG